MNSTALSSSSPAATTASSRPTLVFLHYWGGSSRTWDGVIGALPPAYDTIAPDLRGWGDAAPADSYALADFAADVQQMIATRGLVNYVLVGHSMGGKIAQLLASRRPAGLVGLVLVAPAPPTPLHMPAEARAVMAGAYDTATAVEQAIDHVLTSSPLSPALRLQVIEDSLRGDPAAKKAWPNHTSHEDISAAVGAIAVPVLVVAGALDRVDPAPVLQTEVLGRIAQATMQVLPGTGHLSPLEAPAGVAAAIDAFASALRTC